MNYAIVKKSKDADLKKTIENTERIINEHLQYMAPWVDIYNNDLVFEDDFQELHTEANRLIILQDQKDKYDLFNAEYLKEKKFFFLSKIFSDKKKTGEVKSNNEKIEYSITSLPIVNDALGDLTSYLNLKDLGSLAQVNMEVKSQANFMKIHLAASLGFRGNDVKNVRDYLTEFLKEVKLIVYKKLIPDAYVVLKEYGGVNYEETAKNLKKLNSQETIMLLNAPPMRDAFSWEPLRYNRIKAFLK